MAAKRTDVYFRAAKKKAKPQKLADSNGLYLLVQPNGSKLWRYRYKLDGVENTFAIGNYAQMGLQEAREARDAARRLVKAKLHPAQQRRTAMLVRSHEAANTFEAIAREWIAEHQKGWSPYYLKQVTTVLQADVFKKIGDVPIRDVKAAHIHAITKAVAARPAPTVAVLIRQWCSAIFRYATATVRADHDPAAALKGNVKKPKPQHKRPLPPAELPRLMGVIDEFGGTVEVKTALSLLLRTFVRPGELRQARWEEFDLPNAVWRIPASRMKMGAEHTVPLSSEVRSILTAFKLVSRSKTFLFPNVRDAQRCMSPTTLNRSLERMGYKGVFTAHGFRATASTLLNEMNYRPDVIEKQLAHQEKSASRRPYNQALYLHERRQMMQDWSDYIDSLRTGSVVVPLKGRGRA